MPSISSLPDLFVASTAAGSAGFGAYWHNRWFTGMWPHSMHEVSITVIELFPIVFAAHVWDVVVSDNSTVFAIFNSSFRVPTSMHLVRRLSLVACRHHLSFSARHIPGRSNSALLPSPDCVFRNSADWCHPPTDHLPHCLLA